MDNGAVMISHLLAQFQDKPKLHGLLKVLGRQLDKIETALNDMQEKRGLDTAEGVQLDGCGTIVGQSRVIEKAAYLPFFGFRSQPGGHAFGAAPFCKNRAIAITTSTLDDERYRMAIYAKIAKNTANGTSEDVIYGLRQVFEAARVMIKEGNSKIEAAIGRELTGSDYLFAKNSGLLVKPGGVQLKSTLHFDAAAVFGFREKGFHGFGRGKFARKITEGGL